MSRFHLCAAASYALASVFISSAVAAKNPEPTTAGQTDALSILRQMSDKLGAAHQYSFKANREMSAALAAQRDMQAESQIEVNVRRPNDVAVTSTSNDGVRRLYFDGKHLSILDGKENTYATVPLHGSLDTLSVEMAAKYGFVPPLAVFVISNPFKDIRWRAEKITDAGTASCPSGPSGGDQGECRRIALSGKFADAELWIAASDHLPRKMTATFKGAGAGTALTIDFTDWNLAASIDDQVFAFVPPKDALKIDMVTTAEIEAAMKDQTPKPKQ